MDPGELLTRLLARPAQAAVLAALAILAPACASPPEPAPAPREPASAAPKEDAGPRVLDEDEVDVPARPRAPLDAEYPPHLRRLGVEGSVELLAVVWPDGSVRAARVVASDHPDFADAAREAVLAARFAPARRGSRAVASRVTVHVHFRLAP